MASSPAVAENTAVPAAPSAKIPMVPLILAVLVAVLLGFGAVGGAAFYLVKSGKIALGKAAAGATAEAKPDKPVAPPLTHTMILEPMVANLADPGGAAYLKVSLTLKIEDEPVKKGAAPKEEKPAKGMSAAEAAVRDTVLMVIGHDTADSLLAPEGKEKLKTQLKSALTDHNPELKVEDLYFTDFLVQR